MQKKLETRSKKLPLTVACVIELPNTLSYSPLSVRRRPKNIISLTFLAPPENSLTLLLFMCYMRKKYSGRIRSNVVHIMIWEIISIFLPLVESVHKRAPFKDTSPGC